MIRELENNFKKLHNGTSAPVSEVPLLPEDQFFSDIVKGVFSGARILSFFAAPRKDSELPELWVALGNDEQGEIFLSRTALSRPSFLSITSFVPQAHLFEREIYEQYGIFPEGHPWLKPVRFPSPAKKDKAPVIGVTDYYAIHSEEVHEVGVGPVHAGVIEPGHFRFQCYGEQVLHLEISLGYQHRGVEEALPGGPFKFTLNQIETAAGDTTIGHTWTYSMNLEALCGVTPSPRAQVIRAIALELERLANHTGDLGALAGDVGFLPTMSFCGRLRGDFLNMTALICGNRFGRSLVCPGGVRFDLDEALIEELKKRLSKAYDDVKGAMSLIWETSGVVGRFENTGTVTEDQCRQAGLVGVAARACGVSRDVRIHYPWGPYRYSVIPQAAVPGGDVQARAMSRWLELRRSKRFIDACIANLPSGTPQVNVPALSPDKVAVSLVEGWRGEICHVAITDSESRFRRYKINDPSFHNWQGLALALRGQQISDFPLCNKSFNLSYCGHDL